MVKMMMMIEDAVGGFSEGGEARDVRPPKPGRGPGPGARRGRAGAWGAVAGGAEGGLRPAHTKLLVGQNFRCMQLSLALLPVG